ncbi:uncharacterized protein V1510DRAFT_412026 [Dipodascopsis tothii]|uniref:uncharacterized protein n=1 Tax=Dipodascopsis tothii TaxID=44089 RepID=UPI0034CEDC98
MDGDFVDSLLSLEQSFYNDGYTEGKADGVQAGAAEGTQFGLETGFKRYVNIGLLHGRVRVWTQTAAVRGAETAAEPDPASDVVPLAGGGSRVKKQLQVLASLVTDVPMTNTEPAVETFENNLKRAKARAKVVGSLLRDPRPVELEDEVVQVLPAAAPAEEEIL